MLNYLPVPGGYGLKLKEVQQLKGHTSEKTTAHYAREDRTILAARLEYADQHLWTTGNDLHFLPTLIANRLRAEAEKYEQRTN